MDVVTAVKKPLSKEFMGKILKVPWEIVYELNLSCTHKD